MSFYHLNSLEFNATRAFSGSSMQFFFAAVRPGFDRFMKLQLDVARQAMRVR